MGQTSTTQPTDSDGSSRLTGPANSIFGSQPSKRRSRLLVAELAGHTKVLNFKHDDGHLSIRLFGQGVQHVVLFHGYGQDSTAWLNFIAPYQDQYTFVLFDLYFHGGSDWSDRQSRLNSQNWIRIVDQILSQLSIKEFALGAFSIGAKFALSLCEGFASRISRLILIAPDGLRSRFWYSLATGTTWGNGLFKRLVTRPRILFALTNLLHSLKLIDKPLLGFVASQMNTRQKRLKVYRTWTVFAGLKADMSQIVALLNYHNVPVEVFIGKYDRVISREHVQPLLKKVKLANFYLLEASHQNLLDKVADHYQQNELQLA